MFEDAASYGITVRIYVYGMFVAGGAVAAILAFFLGGRLAKLPRGTSQLWGVTAFMAGLVLSRTFYCLVDSNFASVTSLRAIFMLSGGGYSMMGALTGACLAALWTARTLKIKIPCIMDIILPSLMVFVAIARLGEGNTFLGISRPLVDTAFRDAFFVKFDTDFYLRTYLLESAVAAILAFVLFGLNRRPHREGDTALRGVLLFGTTQTFLESLRYDGHMRIEFISVQQLFCVLLIVAVTLTAAVRLIKLGGKRLFPGIAIGTLPVMAGLLIGLEFLIDRSGISRYILYTGYGLALLCQGIVSSIIIDRSYRLWNVKK